MAQRFAATLAVLAFAICVVVGGVQADNTFATTIVRAVYAMLGTLVVGLAVGWAGQRMIDERTAQARAATEAAGQAPDGPPGRDKNAEGENPASGR